MVGEWNFEIGANGRCIGMCEVWWSFGIAPDIRGRRWRETDEMKNKSSTRR